MAVATQTMTDEQRKSVALEYLKALDPGGPSAGAPGLAERPRVTDARRPFPLQQVESAAGRVGGRGRRRHGGRRKTDRTLVPTCASRSMRSRDITRLRVDNRLKTPDDDVSVPSPKHLSRKKFCFCLTIRTAAEYISSNS